MPGVAVSPVGVQNSIKARIAAEVRVNLLGGWDAIGGGRENAFITAAAGYRPWRPLRSDRSGLVASYAGQTGPKTHKRVDEALDGVLFIDEAYSLVSEGREDAYGHEAVQALLKRMEDDRDRLVLILAGYTAPMQRLLKSNPGLSSRFGATLPFEDYTPGQLGRIFQLMCEKNHYQVPGPTQVRLLAGLHWLYQRRDEHFGNGRLVRNVFEGAVRRLGNRIANVTPLTKKLLTVFEPDDIDLPGATPEPWEDLLSQPWRFRVRCGGCGKESTAPANYVGRRVMCKQCGHRFRAEWGEPCLPGYDAGEKGGP